MPNLDADLVTGGVHRLLVELFDGPDPRGAWILNRDDAGLLSTLERLSAVQASARPIPGRASVAGHANHLRYSLELLNRWAGGDENAFAEADWPGSWAVQAVTDDEWRRLREALRTEAHAWMVASRAPREWDRVALTGLISTAAHAAYHFGAIRQLLGLLERSE